MNCMEFSNVILHQTTGSVQLEVRLMPATNCFEVSENGNLAVSGKLEKCVSLLNIVYLFKYS